ncbi:hypothetical protein GNT65_05755 [Shewanella sp. JBTF-M18]|uniref:Uncharacterized protein n=1 Tax=Shewanella insulae TaxID=2681496 RepID=A0A6L7HV15_9GAMM|nr:hypothetical protein [Shewanella insulae]MXR68179.1 hypothetical protein [Shewanella insulae]
MFPTFFGIPSILGGQIAHSVSQQYLHVSPPQVIGHSEGATFKHLTKIILVNTTTWNKPRVIEEQKKPNRRNVR